MPSRPGPKISDWISQLGLRDLFPPQRRLHHDACPHVEKLREDIKHIADTYFALSTEEIRNSMEIRDATGALLDKYGAIIWSDADKRPWLFDPGQGAAGAKYVKHLRYSDANDNEYLEKTLYGYVLAKVLRWHKDNYRSASKGLSDSRLSETPDHAPDGSYKPFVSRKARISTGGDIHNHLRCVAGSRIDHLDAARLDELGVWLGDFDNAHTSINGPSQRDVEKNYYESTLGGVDCSNAEPQVVADLPNKATSCAGTVVCAACRDDSNSQPLQIQTMKFDWTQDDDSEVEEGAEMRMHAWIYPCTFRGQDVFAFVKELSARECQKIGYPSGQLWSFWKVEGGYTSKVLLAKASQDASFPVLKSDLPGLSSMKRKRSAVGVNDGAPGPSKTSRRDRVSSGIQPWNTLWSPHVSLRSPFQEARQIRTSNNIEQSNSGFQPINGLGEAGAPAGHMEPDIPQTLPTRSRSPLDRSMYDVTPAPATRKTQTSNSISASPSRVLLPEKSSESAKAAEEQPIRESGRNIVERHSAARKGQEAANKAPVKTDLAINLSSNSSESRSTTTSEAHARLTVEASPAVLANSAKDRTPAKDRTSMPPPPPRAQQFKIWFPFQINGTAEVAAKAVRFTTAMCFDDAFAHARSKLEWQLGGRELIGMTIESKVEGKPSLLVDEEDMWGEVVEMVKETGGEELSGTVDME